ncbi:hypothetical protein BH11MYX3_BH11MYX3_01730 [soil metagenome]
MKRLAILALLGACTSDVDPPWQLDHDRVIAVRTTPPRILSGETAAIDALIGRTGDVPVERGPDAVMVVSPVALQSTLTHPASGWTVTAPGEPQLAAARTELGLAAGEPVPVRLRMTFDAPPLVGLKVVWMGEHAENPVIDPVLVNGSAVPDNTPLVVDPVTDIRLDVQFDDSYVVNWLTSAGEMHDFDLPGAYLRIEPETPPSGTLAVVVRDDRGGVAWKLWPISTR